MWLSVMALLLVADPAPDSAEAVFKMMEQAILKCKTFKTDVQIAVGPGKDNILKGRLLVASGNKMRLELAGSLKGKAGKMALVSNGTTMRMTDNSRTGKDQNPPKELTARVLGSASRAGVFVPMFLAVEVAESGKKPEPFNLDKQMAILDMKAGKKESVSGKEAKTLQYKLATKGAKEPLAVTVWIDAKTNLPLKRVIKVKMGEDAITVTETYTKTALDEKIDNKKFELPK
jgi:outer membrane lipoprotein-sorting protein